MTAHLQSASDITNALSEELGVSVGGWLRIGNRFLMGRDRIPAGEYVFRPKGAPPGDVTASSSR